MSKSLAGNPLHISVEGDELVMRIGIDTLTFCFETGNENNPFDDTEGDFVRSYKVTNKYRFAKGVGNALCNEEEDGSTPLTEILDKAFISAVEDDAGIIEDGRIVTSQMMEYTGAKEL